MFPGCESRRYLEIHHVKHWADGGETNLDNLLLLCSHCHRKVHEGGMRLEPGDRARWRFVTAGGWPIPEAPPQVTLPDDPLQAMREHHDKDLGLGITPDTGGARFDPTLDTIDYQWAVEALIEAEQPPEKPPAWYLAEKPATEPAGDQIQECSPA